VGRRKRDPERIIHDDERIQARESEEYIVIEYKQPHTLRIPKSDRSWQDLEMVRMNQLRTLAGRKYIYQEGIGRCFGLSRQMVNRRVMAARRKGIVGLLSGVYQRSKLTPPVLRRIAELFSDNLFVSAERVAEILRSEKVVSGISPGTVWSALELISAAEVIGLLRQRAGRADPQVLLSPGYLIERLFGMLERVAERIQTQRFGGMERLSSDTQNLHQAYERWRPSEASGKSRRRWDAHTPRKNLARDVRRRFNWLWSVLTGKRTHPPRCPDCLTTQIRFRFQRARYAWDCQGRRYRTFSRIYRCRNPACQTHYFTLPPKELELYARYSTEVKHMAFQLLFHVRGSYRRVTDFIAELGIPVHYGTLLRWVKKAGEEYIDMLRLQGRIVAATVIIDEKWVKIRDRWHYVFIATDATADDLLHLDLFKRNDKQAIKCFLLTLKALGIYPNVIVTDLFKGYASVIKDVFPEAYHHECILHAERAARRMVSEYFPGEENKNIRKEFIKKLRWFFESESPEEVTSRFEKMQSLQTHYGEPVRPLIEMLAGYLPKFQGMLERPEIPKTSNTAERVIKELDSKYQNMGGFSSFHVASFMLKVFLVYYRSKKFASGRYQGKSPLQIKGLKLQVLSWTDYLFGHFFSTLCQAGDA
jgi:putative transposase